MATDPKAPKIDWQSPHVQNLLREFKVPLTGASILGSYISQPEGWDYEGGTTHPPGSKRHLTPRPTAEELRALTDFEEMSWLNLSTDPKIAALENERGRHTSGRFGGGQPDVLDQFHSNPERRLAERRRAARRAAAYDAAGMERPAAALPGDVDYRNIDPNDPALFPETRKQKRAAAKALLEDLQDEIAYFDANPLDPADDVRGAWRKADRAKNLRAQQELKEGRHMVQYAHRGDQPPLPKATGKFKSFLKKLPFIGTAVGAGLITSDVQAAFDRGGEEEAAKVMAIELARMGDPGFELAYDVANVFPGAAKEIMSAIAPKLPPEKRAQFAGEDYVGATDVERKQQEEVGPTP